MAKPEFNPRSLWLQCLCPSYVHSRKEPEAVRPLGKALGITEAKMRRAQWGRCKPLGMEVWIAL